MVSYTRDYSYYVVWIISGYTSNNHWNASSIYWKKNKRESCDKNSLPKILACTHQVIMMEVTSTNRLANIKTVTDMPITVDWLSSSCFHPAALVLDGDENRSLVLTVFVKVAIRMCSELDLLTLSMVLAGDKRSSSTLQLCECSQ